MSSYQDDTQPKPPRDSREIAPPSSLEDTGPRQATQPFYVSPMALPTSTTSSCWGRLMLVGVLVMASCLCLSIIALSGVAGVRDELDSIGTQAVATRVARVETQYALGVSDFDQGRYELAGIRFADVQTLMPGYLDVEVRLQTAQAILSYTPTPSPSSTLLVQTATPLPPSATVLATDSSSPTATEGVEVADLFGQAETAMTLGFYEEAIKWLDALILLDPTYRRDEAQEMLLNAHIAQGRIYLRSQNEDGEDRLAQGVQLINRASELGTVPGELLYEADFVARYLAARAYVDGGAYDQARQVLTRLCEEDCDWTYRGRSVRDLLTQAGGVPQ
jgi:tetratricopeptide (TPR) repeat protein